MTTSAVPKRFQKPVTSIYEDQKKFTQYEPVMIVRSVASPSKFYKRMRRGNDQSRVARPDTPQTSKLHSEAMSLLDAPTTIVQNAFEAAIFQIEFEIDERGPLSRLQALTEELLDGANNMSSNETSEAEILPAVRDNLRRRGISKRVHASILHAQPDSRASIRRSEDLHKRVSTRVRSP